MTRYSGIIGVLLVVGILAYMLLGWLAKPETLPIAKIELLTKLHQQDANGLQIVASQAINGGFFSLDLEYFRQQIENLAWVESVSIRKKWPDIIQISIFEKTAVARWVTINEDEEPKVTEQLWSSKQLISDKGEIFSPPLNEPQVQKFSTYNLYMGPGGLAKKVLQNCQKMTEELSQASLQVEICGLDRRRAWNIKLYDGFRLRLGRELLTGATVRRIEDFIKVYRKTLHKYVSRIAHVDMRYTNGLTVGWKENTKSKTIQD